MIQQVDHHWKSTKSREFPITSKDEIEEHTIVELELSECQNGEIEKDCDFWREREIY